MKTIVKAIFSSVLLFFSSCVYDTEKEEYLESSFLTGIVSRYDQAKYLNQQGDFEGALALYKGIVSADSLSERLTLDEGDSLYKYISFSINKITNIGIYHNKVDSVIDMLGKLALRKDGIVGNNCKRDLYINLAFLSFFKDDDTLSDYYASKALEYEPYMDLAELRFRDYSYLSTIYCNDNTRNEDLFRWITIAKEAAASYGHFNGVQWCITLYAQICSRLGMIEEASKAYCEALELSYEQKDLYGEAHALINLSKLYSEWGMFSQADDYAQKAFSSITEIGEMTVAVNVCIVKAQVKEDMNQIDSMFYYYGKASEYVASSPDVSINRWLERLYNSAVIRYGNIASVGESVSALVNLIPDYQGHSNLHNLLFFIGNGYARLGNYAVAESYFDRMFDAMRMESIDTYSKYQSEYLLDYYIKRGDYAKVAVAAEYYKGVMENFYDNIYLEQMSAALSRFQQLNSEQQQMIVSTEQRAGNLKLMVILAVMLIVILLMGIVLILYRKKVVMVQSKLSDIEARKGIEQTIDLKPALFKTEGESRFRRHFKALYPEFQKNLKKKIENPTRNEELLCMFICLGESVDGISEILSIEPGSVRMIRYRLRKKIGLDKNDSLEEWVKSLI